MHGSSLEEIITEQFYEQEKNNKLMIKSIRFIILGHLMFVRQKCVIIRILLIVKPKNNIQKTHYFSSLIFTFLNQTSSP